FYGDVAQHSHARTDPNIVGDVDRLRDYGIVFYRRSPVVPRVIEAQHAASMGNRDIIAYGASADGVDVAGLVDGNIVSHPEPASVQDRDVSSDKDVFSNGLGIGFQKRIAQQQRKLPTKRAAHV